MQCGERDRTGAMGWPPPCVSYYRVSPGLMGLTAISSITSLASCQEETGTCTADIWHIPRHRRLPATRKWMKEH